MALSMTAGNSVPDTARPLFRRSLARYLGGGLVISTGEVEFESAERVTAPLSRGFKIAVTLAGRISCRIDDRPPVDMAGPNICLFLNTRDHRREQIFAPGQRLRYALIQMTPDLIVDRLGLSFDALMAAAKRLDGGRDPAVLSRPADQVIRSIASTIMGCPLEGMARDLYLIGKAFELAALSIEQFLPKAAAPRRGALPLSEVERVQAAREILLERYRNPPSVAALAREVGLNVRKLNVGFRRAFGMTVHAFLQEHRLQVAYQQIADGELNISQVAYGVGYAPAHFATIFRRRFGLSPSELR